MTIAFESGIAEGYFEQNCENKLETNSDCHGQCHLHQQLENTNNDSPTPSNGVKLTFDRDYTISAFSDHQITIIGNTIQKPNLGFNLYPSCFLEVDTAPPEC